MRRIVHASRWRTPVTLLLVLAAATACGKDDVTAPASPSIAGRWTGSANFGTVQFEATFTQSGETVAGTGEVSTLLGSDSFTATGTVRGQDVALTLATSDNMTGFTGRFTGANTIEGILNPPGETLKIVRQR